VGVDRVEIGVVVVAGGPWGEVRGTSAGMDTICEGRGMWEAKLDEDKPNSSGSKSVDFPLAEPTRPSLVKESIAVLTIFIRLALSSTNLLSVSSRTDSATGEVDGEELINQPSPTNGVNSKNTENNAERVLPESN
jgi:hypothetical protein